MSTAAFYSGILATIFAVAFSTSCPRSITCPCGSSNQNYTHCLNNALDETFTCESWVQCQTCRANTTHCITCPPKRFGPTCTEDTEDLIGRKRKFQYAVRHCALEMKGKGFYNCTTTTHRTLCDITCGNKKKGRYYCYPPRDWNPQLPSCAISKSGGHCALELKGESFYNCTSNVDGTFCDITCGSKKAGQYHCYPAREWKPRLPDCAVPKGTDTKDRLTRAAPCLCQNGGTCVKRGKCSCPAGTTGSFCEVESENNGRDCSLRITGAGVYNCTVSAHGTMCDITCDDVPRGRHYCRGNEWNPQLPYCTAPKVPFSSCPDPGSIPSGYRRFMNGTIPQVYSYGQSYKYFCNIGYELQGNNVITCLTSGKWSSNKPSCQRILDLNSGHISYCSDPVQIPFGSYHSNGGNPGTYQQYSVEQFVTYYCQSGYDLIGNRVVTCLPSGSWSKKPSCRKTRTPPVLFDTDTMATCPDPGSITFGYRRLTNGAASMSSRTYTNGQSFQYFCNQGYELIGNKVLTCLRSGKWSSNTPLCQRSVTGISGPFCPFPEVDVTGMIIEPFLDINNRGQTFPPGTEMKFDCEDGYEIEGKFWIIYCKLDGEWTSEPPKCKQDPTYKAPPPIYCNYPGIDENGIVEGDNEAKVVGQTQAYVPGAELRYMCRDGYEVVGSRNIVCTLDGEWSADPPTCRVTLTTTAKPPDELRIVCPNPSVDPNGSIEYNPLYDPRGQGYEAGSQVNFTCRNGYELKGPSSIICLRSGRWTDNPPTCQRRSRTYDTVLCTDPGSIQNGGLIVYYNNINASSLPSPEPYNAFEYPVGTRLRYDCSSGYRLEGEKDLYCRSSGRWSEDKPRCIEDCGLSPLRAGGKVTYGNETTAGEFPWMVFLYMNETGETCAGVLLDRTTVLSAAHCFQFAEYCTLYFGKYNRSDANDDEFVETRTSSEIITHSEFDIRTFNNDIAIVKFSPAVRYTMRIQPICMPTPETTDINIIPGEKGFIAGWGRNEDQRPTSRLMLANLPIQESENCTLAYRSRNQTINITPGMFCAGFADRLINACRGDSGSPMVFYNNETERFVVEGLVSHGTSGRCDQEERYTMFTRVSFYLDWMLRYWRPERR